MTETRAAGATDSGLVPGWKKVEEGRRRAGTERQTETRGQRDTGKPGWCVSFGCRLGLGPSEKKEAGSREKQDRGTDRRRELS